MKPGDVLAEGVLGIRACAILNDLGSLIGLPSIILEKVRVDSGITPEWPLGIYALFVEDGILLGIHGKTSGGETTDKYSFLELEEDKIPDIGEDTWNMWKKLRSISDEVVEVNYQELLKQTRESSN